MRKKKESVNVSFLHGQKYRPWRAFFTSRFNVYLFFAPCERVYLFFGTWRNISVPGRCANACADAQVLGRSEGDTKNYFQVQTGTTNIPGIPDYYYIIFATRWLSRNNASGEKLHSVTSSSGKYTACRHATSNPTTKHQTAAEVTATAVSSSSSSRRITRRRSVPKSFSLSWRSWPRYW